MGMSQGAVSLQLCHRSNTQLRRSAHYVTNYCLWRASPVRNGNHVDKRRGIMIYIILYM